MKILLKLTFFTLFIYSCSEEFPEQEQLEPVVDTVRTEIIIKEIVRDSIVFLDTNHNAISEKEFISLLERVKYLEAWTNDHEHQKDTLFLSGDTIHILNERITRDSVWIVRHDSIHIYNTQIIEKYIYNRDTVEFHHYHETTNKDTVYIEKTVTNIDTIYFQVHKNQETLDFLAENFKILFSNENVTDYPIIPYYESDIILEQFITLQSYYNPYEERNTYSLLVDLTPAFIDEAQLYYLIEFKEKPEFNTVIDTSMISNQNLEFRTTYGSNDYWRNQESYPSWKILPDVKVVFSGSNVSISFDTEVRAYFDHGNNYVTHEKGRLKLDAKDIPFRNRH